MKKKTKVSSAIKLEDEVLAIKRLLILQLLKTGAGQKEVAFALGMDKGNFSRMFPVRKILGAKKQK